MKTINEDIDVFNTYKQALRAFNKTASGHLLEAKVGSKSYYYIDRAKTAKELWEHKYKLLKEK